MGHLPCRPDGTGKPSIRTQKDINGFKIGSVEFSKKKIYKFSLELKKGEGWGPTGTAFSEGTTRAKARKALLKELKTDYPKLKYKVGK